MLASRGSSKRSDQKAENMVRIGGKEKERMVREYGEYRREGKRKDFKEGDIEESITLDTRMLEVVYLGWVIFPYSGYISLKVVASSL